MLPTHAQGAAGLQCLHAGTAWRAEMHEQATGGSSSGGCLLGGRRLEDAGALQPPWARLAYAQALLAGGDEEGCRGVLQAALRTFHIADKSEVDAPSTLFCSDSLLT